MKTKLTTRNMLFPCPRCTRRLWEIAICLLTCVFLFGAVRGAEKSDLNQALLDKCRTGDLEKVSQLVADGADLNCTGDRNRTPLMIATMNGNLELAKFLVEKGASIDAKDADGKTASRLAIELGRSKIASLLESASPKGKARFILDDLSAVWNEIHFSDEPALRYALVETVGLVLREVGPKEAKRLFDGYPKLPLRGRFGRVALLGAIDKDDNSVAEFLIDNGVYVNTRVGSYLSENKNETALMLAVKKGNQKIVERLLQKGASVNAMTEADERTALGFAESKPEMQELLKRYGAVESPKQLNGAFLSAVESGDGDMALALLNKGADIDASPRGKSPLLIAIRAGEPKMVKLLLEKHADALDPALLNNLIDALNENQAAGRNDIVRVLIEAGMPVTQEMIQQLAESHAPDVDVLSVLINAGVNLPRYFLNPEDGAEVADVVIKQRRSDILEKLLAKDLEPDVVDNRRNSEPLLVKAAISGDTNTLRLLLDKGANVNAENGGGNSALCFAVITTNFGVADMLVRHGANPNTAVDATATVGFARDYGLNNTEPLLTWAVRNRHIPFVSLLLEKGADVQKPDQTGYTPLLLAAKDGNMPMAMLLLEKGADINATSMDGADVIILTVRSKNEELSKLLLEKGAGVSGNDLKGMTPLMYSAGLGQVATVRLLLEKGASINAENNEGVTALMLAAVNGEAAVTRLLLEKKANPNVITKDREATALSLANAKGHQEIAQMIKQAGGKEPPSPERVDSTKLTKAEWKKRVEPYDPSHSPVQMITAQKFKSLFGEPARTQSVELKVYWYYQCIDGTIQMVLIDPNATGGVMAIEVINDF